MDAQLTTPDLSKHPCFNPAMAGKFGRIHLPVAPKCNVQCNFCHRKNDCSNESRPGGTRRVLTPAQAPADGVRWPARRRAETAQRWCS